MRGPQAVAIAISVGTLLAGVCGCRNGEGRGTAARQREWASLQQSKRALDAERRRLARLRADLAAAPVAVDGSPLGDAAALADAVAATERRVAAGSAALEGRLVRLVGASEPGGGASPPAALARVIRLKSDEDIEVAREWIERGGDYRRAIEIYELQRQVDPGYPRLEQALARARAMRYVTAERFARVRPGMTAAEVRAALGPVNLREVLRRPAEQLEAWYYPRVGGGRVGVYFQYEPRRRAFLVYETELATGVPVPPSAPASTVG